MLLLLNVCVLFSFSPDIFAIAPQPRRSNWKTAGQRNTVENRTEESIPLLRAVPQASDNIDYRLTRLEVQVGEKAETIRSELRETNRRLQALEWQSAETHSALETFRAELQRFTQQAAPSLSHVPDEHERDSKLEERVDHLAKGVMLMVVNMRTLTADVTAIKNNVAVIDNKTSTILRENKQLLTKQFFNNGLLDIRHRPEYHHQTCPLQKTSAKELPKDCKEVQNMVSKKSGVYRIQPEHSPTSFMAYCDMDTRGGGWVVIHRRHEGAQDFYQNWHDYKYGFGNLAGEFWLGLDNIYQLTGYEVSELLVELEDFSSAQSYAHYDAFSIGPEVEGFPLKVLGGYNGDAGDSLIYQAGNRFSTKDMDQDAWPEGSCAQAHGGGWWYRGCDTSNLNGRYLSGELPEQYIYQGMYWGEFRGAQYSLFKARMLVRPRDRSSPAESFDVNANETDSN